MPLIAHPLLAPQGARVHRAAAHCCCAGAAAAPLVGPSASAAAPTSSGGQAVQEPFAATSTASRQGRPTVHHQLCDESLLAFVVAAGTAIAITGITVRHWQDPRPSDPSPT